MSCYTLEGQSQATLPEIEQVDHASAMGTACRAAKAAYGVAIVARAALYALPRAPLIVR